MPELRLFVTAGSLTVAASPLLTQPASFVAPVGGTAAPAEIADDNGWR